MIEQHTQHFSQKDHGSCKHEYCGIRDFFYPVDKQKKGHLCHLKICLSSDDDLQKFRTSLKHDERITRWFIQRVKKLDDDQTPLYFEVDPQAFAKVLETVEPSEDTVNPLEMPISYEYPENLLHFVSKTGAILPRKVTGMNAKNQRHLASQIKIARYLALLPYATDDLKKD